MQASSFSSLMAQQRWRRLVSAIVNHLASNDGISFPVSFFFQVSHKIAAAAPVVVALVIVMVYATVGSTGPITQVLPLQLLFGCEKKLTRKATLNPPPPNKKDACKRSRLVYMFSCSSPEIRLEVGRDMLAPTLSWPQPEGEISQSSVCSFIFLRRPGVRTAPGFETSRPIIIIAGSESGSHV